MSELATSENLLTGVHIVIIFHTNIALGKQKNALIRFFFWLFLVAQQIKCEHILTIVFCILKLNILQELYDLFLDYFSKMSAHYISSEKINSKRWKIPSYLHQLEGKSFFAQWALHLMVDSYF